MPDPISPISSVALSASLSSVGRDSQPGAFQQILETAMQTVQSTQSDAAANIEKFLSGESEELHSTVLSVQRAQIAFDLGLQVRNKVLDAYQEIMRMQM
jgi:flagellar hook-basal body complex protein FliE